MNRLMTVTPFYSGVSHEDERSERDIGSDDDSNSEPTPDEVPSNTEMEGDNKVGDDSIVITSTIDKTTAIDNQSQSSKESSRHGEGDSRAEHDEDKGDNNDVETDNVSQRSNLRARKNNNYKNLHRYVEVQLMQLQKNWINTHKETSVTKGTEVKNNDLHRRVSNTTFTQMAKDDRYAQVPVSEGIKRHGEKAIMAVLKEYAQLNDKDVFKACDGNKLTYDEKKSALNLITMVREKRDGKIKGRACADGRKQRRYITKEEVSSPTIQLESLMITLLVDAHERRDVATADVAGAYLFADINDNVLIKIIGTATDIMCKVNPSYRKFVLNERGKNVLYLRLTKALYGCMQSVLLWYRTFKECLEELGFKLNPYDPCVANMTVKGEQCTICWYVDDTKISHRNSKVVDWVIKELEDRFGKMTVKRGKKHTFVGIDIEFNEDGTVSLLMDEYIQECIDIYDNNLKGKAATPAKGDLFDEDSSQNAELLTKQYTDKYHHTTAKILYVAKRVRLDIDLAISFLCTRVTQTSIGDEMKLKRVLSY